MPYTIRKGKGDRPYRIINKQTRKVVGTSTSLAKAKASIGHRESAEAKNIKKYKRKVDNKMRSYGDTDYEKKVVRVNKSKKKNKRPGEVLDTIVHEKMHVRHPKMHEKTVVKRTRKVVKTMSKKEKAKHYKLFNK